MLNETPISFTGRYASVLKDDYISCMLEAQPPARFYGQDIKAEKQIQLQDIN